jgi:hypothetical protein
MRVNGTPGKPLPKCDGHLCRIRFRANTAEPEHTCPFQAAVNNNPDYKCNCCDACRQNCQDDT